MGSPRRASWSISTVARGTSTLAELLAGRWWFCLDAATPDLAKGEAERMGKSHPENAYLVSKGKTQKWVVVDGETHPIDVQGRAVAA